MDTVFGEQLLADLGGTSPPPPHSHLLTKSAKEYLTGSLTCSVFNNCPVFYCIASLHVLLLVAEVFTLLAKKTFFANVDIP